ncbi:MAG: family 31 glucosidase [Treponema sp.]|nr:family 31 glucosidase [Treponema sp.]
MITQEKNRLIIKDGFGTVWIEPWGKYSVRVRMTADRKMDANDWALENNEGEQMKPVFAEQKLEAQVAQTTNKNSAETCAPLKNPCAISIRDVDTTYPWSAHFEGVPQTTGQEATLQNGRLLVKVNHEGWLSFWQVGSTVSELEPGVVVESDKNKPTLLFEEQWRNRWRIDRFCVPTNHNARELKPVAGTFGWRATCRFEAYDDEKLFGMGQYQDSHLDKKGGIWELSQKNSQASVPFVISSRGYGFLWNNPAIGTASFGTNGTIWTAEQTQKIDYWVTCGTPSQIEENYTAVTGRTPMMPDFAMGFWQCKLRYRTQEEVLNVAREYRRRNLPLDVIVIDFFHWTCQGDFKFDPKDWPDPDAMVRELSELGVRLMVSVWPTVDERSENFEEMAQQGLLISFDKRNGFNMDWMGNTVFFDTTNPATREYVWEKCKENYFKKGIQLFWLDEAEPEYGLYEFEHYKYHLGPALECSNIYPYYYAKGFYDGLKAEGVKNPLSLVRCAWAGSQKFGAVVWSGDVHSDFRSFRNQIQAGLSMAIAGIPWWTTDIGGFLGGDIKDDSFKELLVRWFQWGVFCPVMRLHGERPPFKPLEEPFHQIRGHQIKQMESGQDNEIWCFGSLADGTDIYTILQAWLRLRESLRPYIKEKMQAANQKGTPVMRPLFYDFADDELSWEVEDEYMFGDEYLVCPVTEAGATSRVVYLPPLPEGELWTEIAFESENSAQSGAETTKTPLSFNGKKYKGGQTITANAPLSIMPVFKRCN